LDTVKGLGVRMIKAELQVNDGLKDVIRDAKTALLKDKKVRAEDVFAMINCTGWSVRDFAEEEGREKLRPILGQTLLLEEETKFAGTCAGFPEEWDSYMPSHVLGPGRRFLEGLVLSVRFMTGTRM
jgi:hypothetical protein